MYSYGRCGLLCRTLVGVRGWVAGSLRTFGRLGIGSLTILGVFSGLGIGIWIGVFTFC